MFKKGDLVFVKKGPHRTTGCDAFHEQMERWKKEEYQFELETYTEWGGQICWKTMGAQGWIIGESDLELVNFTLENE